jgi:hypothetical protein
MQKLVVADWQSAEVLQVVPNVGPPPPASLTVAALKSGVPEATAPS